MALLFCDSFDHYSNAQTIRKWPGAGGSFFGSSGPSSTFGRNGTNGMLLFGNGVNGAFLIRSLPATKQTLILGAAVRMGSLTNWAYIFALLDVTTNQVNIRAQPDGSIQARRGATVLGTSAPGLLNTTAHKSVQAKFHIHASAGSVEVRVDNVTVLNVTGVNTQATANAYATQYMLGENNVDFNFAIDDFWICDTTGAKNNDFLGDKRIKWCPALAEGAQSDYTPSSGSDNAAMVDENPANDDTDYIESSTVGHIDYVTISVSPAIPAGATVDAVQVVTVAKKTDGGTRTARHKIRFGSGPTVSNGAAYAPGTGYTADLTVFEDTITVSEVNAPMQVGSEVLT